LLICPSGDGPTLAEIGATIEVFVFDYSGTAVQGMPAEDFWIQRSMPPNTLCGGSQSSAADAPTDANGRTTISGSVAAGGFFGDETYVIAAGWAVQAPPECHSPLPLVLVSPDMNGDLIVDSVDFAIFASSFPPSAYAKEADMDGDGTVSVVDFGLFGLHWRHTCGR
jgi:hypothetical protein